MSSVNACRHDLWLSNNATIHLQTETRVATLLTSHKYFKEASVMKFIKTLQLAALAATAVATKYDSVSTNGRVRFLLLLCM